MKRKHHGPDCLSEAELSTCLDPIGQISDAAENHLADCPACQNKLEYLSAAPDQWAGVQAALQAPESEASRRIARSICPLRADGTACDSSEQEEPAAIHCERELEYLQEKLAPASHPELLGRIDRYEVEQLVGYGGMGLVFRGHDTELHRVVAIKTITSGLIPNGTVKQRFFQEARAVASLSHAHIVSVHDIITTGPVPAIVMQYVAGPTLGEHLSKNGPMAWRAVLQLGVQLCDALETAHRSGLIHRDIKPGNVLLEANGTRAMLTDFGLVRILDNKTITRSGVIPGTPEFMSPEQAWGKTLDPRSDLFSFGSLLYTMLTGKSPFASIEAMATLNKLCNEPHRPLQEYSRDIPRQVVKLVDRLLAKQSRRRLSTAAEVRDQMQDLLQSGVSLESDGHRNRRRMLLAAAGMCIAFCLLGIYALQPKFSQYVPIHNYFGTAKQSSPAGVMSRQQAVQAALVSGASMSDVQPETYSGYAVFESTGQAIQEINARANKLEQQLFSRQDSTHRGEQTASRDGFTSELGSLTRALERLETQVNGESH